MCLTSQSVPTFLLVPQVGSSTESVNRLPKGLQTMDRRSPEENLEPGAQFVTGRPERHQDRRTRAQYDSAEVRSGLS